MDKPWDDPRGRSRTVLVFALAPLWTPHFETELEIVAGHQAAGDVVHVATCNRAMNSCLASPNGRLYACLTCTSRAAHGFDVTAVPTDRRHTLDIRACSHFTAPSFGSIDDLKTFHVDGVDVGAAAASSLISIARDSEPDMTEHAELVRDLLASSVGVFRSSAALLSSLRPDLAYVFNGRFASTQPLVRACERSSVEFVTHEAGYELGTYRLIANSSIHELGTIKRAIEDTWNDSDLSVVERTRIGREFFIGRRTGGEGDAMAEYRFSHHQSRGALPAEVTGWPGRRVAIFNSSEDEFAVADTFANPVYKDQLEALDVIARHQWPIDTRIFIREHPNLRGLHNTQTARLRALAELPQVTVIRAESIVDSYALLEIADLAVTFGSTIGAEAVFWECPSVLVGRAMFEDLGVVRPMSHEEVIAAMLRTYDRPAPDDMLRYGFFERRWCVPFERFHQDTHRGGTFDGVSIQPRRLRKAASVALHLGAAITDPEERRALTERLPVHRGSAKRAP